MAHPSRNPRSFQLLIVSSVIAVFLAISGISMRADNHKTQDSTVAKPDEAREEIQKARLKQELLEKRERAHEEALRNGTIVPHVAPTNDLCSGAEVVPAAGPFPYLTAVTTDITDATTVGDPPTPSCQTNISRSIWYTFQPSTSAAYTFSLCADSPTGTTVDDTVMAIYTSTGGCAGTFTQVTGACDDDTCVTETLQSVVSNVPMTAGTTYYIVVWQFGTTPPTAGNTAVQMRVTQNLPPSNDTCAAPTPLTLNTPVTGSTMLGSNDYQLSGSACFTGVGQTASTAPGRDVVYSFTAPSAGTYSFRVTDYSITNNLVLYAASDCPSGTPPVTVVNCLAASNRNTANPSEEIFCLSLTSGQQIFLFVDENAFTSGSAFTIEAFACSTETEPNDAPATANPFVCGMEGSITPAAEADFFSLGSPPAGSRVFAIADGVAGNSTDFDMRITTTTDTLEYDDLNNDGPFGGLAPNVAGTPLTGAPAFIRINHFTATTQAQPYRLFAIVQPPIASAIVETEPNNTIAQANSNSLNYFSGSLAGPSPSTDVDIYQFTAQAGDLVYIGLDGDPLRNNTPINGALSLLDPAGTTLVAVNDGGSTSSTTSGAGSLTAATPTSPAEGLHYRIRTSGTYYARVGIGTTSTSTTGNGDYLLSIAINCGVVTNTPPTFTPAGAISRQQGSPAGAAVTVGTVTDTETAPGALTVTQIAGGTATGITVTGITNTNGTITAQVAAGCTAASGTVRFQVTDAGMLMGTGDLQVNVTPNSAPTLTYAGPQNVAFNGSVTVNPATGPTDNGSINTIVVQSVGMYTGTISVNALTGVVSISNAAPAGMHTITVRATDDCGSFTDATFTLNVATGNTPPTFTPAGAIGRQQGSPAGAAVTVGTVTDTETAPGALTVTQIAGGTATGITVTGITNTNGTITAQVAAGCTAIAGTVRFQVTDAGMLMDTGDLQVNVTPNSAPTLTYAGPQNVAFNGSTTVNPATGPTDNGSISTIALQSQGTYTGTISVNASTGVVSISNAAPVGSHTITIRATDNCGSFTDTAFTLTVACPTIAVNPTSLPGGAAGTPYSQTLTATGTVGAPNFTVSGGTLPTGLTLNPTTGVLSGTPTTSGTFNFTVRATDTNPGSNTCFGERAYSVGIGCPTITVNPTSVPGGTAGVAYPGTSFSATGGTGPYGFTLTAGTLPAGMSFSGGAILGTPTVTGTFNFTITATDTATGCTGTRMYSLVIACPTVTVNPATLPGANVGFAYNQTVTGAGGIAPYTFTVSAGALPSGLTLNPTTGAIAGTATTAGTFTFTVTATDANGCTGTRSYTVAVAGVELSRLYVADTDNSRVQIFDGTSWSLAPLTSGLPGSGIGTFRSPEAVVATQDGRIFVADTGNNRIHFFNGSAWSDFAALGSALNQVRAPQGLTLDVTGQFLFVADTGNNRIIRFNTATPFGAGVVIAVGGSSPGQVNGPRGLIVDNGGTLYVADTGNNRIQRFTGVTGAGPFTATVIAGAGGSLAPAQVTAPEGVAVDNNGTLYVADTGNSRILQIAAPAPGASAILLASLGTTLGQVRSAEGITIANLSTGRALIVSDTANGRIQARPIAGGAWTLVSGPGVQTGALGSGIGQFRSPSKIR